jgi:hypothetical protein
MYTARTTTLKPISLRTLSSAALLTLLALILLITPALAKAPGEGTVFEGKSVPGVALGDTRERVIKVFGEPLRCDILSLTNSTYNCSFAVDGGGKVDIRFKRSSTSPQIVRFDKVTIIRWSQEVAGWVTTAGINTKIALADPKAVLMAYPHAAVKYSASGKIVQVRDPRLGIQVDWLSSSSDSDRATGLVSMAIFVPVRITP